MRLTPEILLRGYARGIFPMAEHRDDPEVFWVDPRRRGILPLDGFHASRSLRKLMRNTDMRCALDRDFAGVVDACADRADTWINADIRQQYLALHSLGAAHSFELWEGDALVGGVYGVVLGAAFFGESMFSRRRDASKIALCCLVDHLLACGFTLFDTQFLTEHLASLGGVEIAREDYRALLKDALQFKALALDAKVVPQPYDVVQRMAQTS